MIRRLTSEQTILISFISNFNKIFFLTFLGLSLVEGKLQA
jgi:hypothetical protein